jgi:hypothetical protein
VRRRRIPRRKAAEALADGACMFTPLGGCDGNPTPQTLGWDAIVLVCEQHTPDLRELRRDLAEARRVRRYLEHRFVKPVAA